jgi:hypothetical protein
MHLGNAYGGLLEINEVNSSSCRTEVPQNVEFKKALLVLSNSLGKAAGCLID